MAKMTTLPLHSDEGQEPPRRASGAMAALLIGLLVLLGLVAFLVYRAEQRMAGVERAVAALSVKTEDAAALAAQASDRATAAETAARTAAELRQAAEAATARAREEADTARQEATTAKETAESVQAEAEHVRKRAEAEVGRLEEALGQVAETRRTALGLVMNLSGEHLKFEFNKAELRPQDKELLSRIAGILLTSHDYTISVNGHTDDIGSDAYNQQLSERRAQAVRDYLVKAGLPEDILSVEGHGKALPLAPGSSDKARAQNRRVELGIVNTQIRYGR
ncbi:MAG TPA: OmpA family protein [Vicinamibacteria bacterium]|nr:OmpA family protein [Vicinamibacteria bacterium]